MHHLAKTITLTVAVLVSTFFALTPVLAVSQQTPSHTVQFSLDNVNIRASGTFLSASSKFAVSDTGLIATTGTSTPYQLFEIEAIPYGLQDADQVSLVASQGKASAFRDALRNGRLTNGGRLYSSPTISLFNQSISGETVIEQANLHGLTKEPVLIAEWIVEAGQRIWLVRYAQSIAPNISDTNALKASHAFLISITLSSTSLNNPSAGIHIPAPAKATPQTIKPETFISSPLPAPSWWSPSTITSCDTGRYSGSYASSYSYRSMYACGPGGTVAYTNFGISGGIQVEEWQCVELSMRFMDLAYQVAPYGANGNQIVTNYHGSRLVAINDGTVGVFPQPNDIMSYGATDVNGHTNVVTGLTITDATNGNGSITTIDENIPITHTLQIVKWHVQYNNSGVVGTIGWLHDPNNGGTTVSQRIGEVDTSGTLAMKDGSLGSMWYNSLYGNVQSAASSGTRLGVVGPDGCLYVKDGTLTSAWSGPLYCSVKAFALYGTRIGVLDTSNNLYVKDGTLSATWNGPLYSNVKAFALSNTRIGVLDASNNLYVKQGSVSGSWVGPLYSNVQFFVLSDTRIGVLDTSNNLYVTQGSSLGTSWTGPIYSNVQSFALTDVTVDRIGVVGPDGCLYMKEGSITSTWSGALYCNVKAFALYDTQVGVLDTSKNMWAKEGSLSSSWTGPMYSNVASLVLPDNGSSV